MAKNKTQQTEEMDKVATITVVSKTKTHENEDLRPKTRTPYNFTFYQGLSFHFFEN